MTTNAAPATNITVDIVSDTACPWCFIGKRRLEKAMDIVKQRHPNTTFSVNWHPYQLDATLSTTPIKKLDMYARKFGPDRSTQVQQRMIQVGEGDGIHFTYEGNIVNTMMSHRLIKYATDYDNKQQQSGTPSHRQDAIVEELFKDYFESNKCGELESLVEAAAKVGFDRDEIRAYLSSDQGVQEIKQEIAHARAEGVQGVPHFTIQDKYVLSGAQEPSTFAEVFGRVLQEQQNH
ncbi:hypothetical protein DFQ26_001808 [Actinomortierella ambigua]|nr:hypothetical protein DFQ26_001808 [Actinomortierella ambigua]